MDEKIPVAQETATETTSLTDEDVSATPIAPTPALDAVCYNDDPRDAAYSYYDSDPTNTQW